MPKGFRPVRKLDGADYDGATHKFKIDPSNTTPIGQWHPVALSSGRIVAGTAGSAICGVLMGVEYRDPNGKKVFATNWPGTAGCTDIFALVADSPDLVFETETTTAAGSIADTFVGTTAAFVAGTIDSGTKVSGAQLSNSGNGFIVVGLPEEPKNVLPKTNAIVHVAPLLHQFGH